MNSTDGAVGYVDFSDANASGLTFASVKNSSGKFIKPNLLSAASAASGATVNPDLTFDPLNASGPAAYPITSPTWILVYKDQTDAAKGAAIVAFLNYIYKQGQGWPVRSTTRRLPKCAPPEGDGRRFAASPSRRRDLGRVVHGTGGPPPVPCPRP